MEAVRPKWTDERLDDLANRMDAGFARVDEEFRALRAEMNSRFDSMQRTMFGILGSMVVGFLVTNL